MNNINLNNGSLKQTILTFIIDNYEDIASNGQLQLLPHLTYQEINVAFNLYILKLMKSKTA
jgi:hypothetical protein